jgi:drug/metabolite transporter (DMT)-like permease
VKKIDTNLIIYGYLSAIGATIIWSGNFVVARGLTDSIPPVSLAFWRWMVAIIVFMPFAVRHIASDWDLIKSHLVYLIATSILGVSLFNTLIYIAGHSTTAINLSLIAITFPVFIIILSRIFYGEVITINKWIGILLVVIGILALITKGDWSIMQKISFAKGDLWMLLAALTFAIYSLMVKHKPAQLGAWSFQFATFVIGLLFLAPFYIWEAVTTDFQIKSIDSNTLYSILYLGIFASLIAFILWAKAIHVVGPTKSSMIYYTLPIFSGILAYVFLGEAIGMLHLLSMLLIVTGIITAIYNPKAWLVYKRYR